MVSITNYDDNFMPYLSPSGCQNCFFTSSFYSVTAFAELCNKTSRKNTERVHMRQMVFDNCPSTFDMCQTVNQTVPFCDRKIPFTSSCEKHSPSPKEHSEKRMEYSAEVSNHMIISTFASIDEDYPSLHDQPSNKRHQQVHDSLLSHPSGCRVYMDHDLATNCHLQLPRCSNNYRKLFFASDTQYTLCNQRHFVTKENNYFSKVSELKNNYMNYNSAIILPAATNYNSASIVPAATNYNSAIIVPAATNSMQHIPFVDKNNYDKNFKNRIQYELFFPGSQLHFEDNLVLFENANTTMATTTTASIEESNSYAVTSDITKSLSNGDKHHFRHSKNSPFFTFCFLLCCKKRNHLHKSKSPTQHRMSVVVAARNGMEQTVSTSLTQLLPIRIPSEYNSEPIPNPGSMLHSQQPSDNTMSFFKEYDLINKDKCKTRITNNSSVNNIYHYSVTSNKNGDYACLRKYANLNKANIHKENIQNNNSLYVSCALLNIGSEDECKDITVPTDKPQDSCSLQQTVSFYDNVLYSRVHWSDICDTYMPNNFEINSAQSQKHGVLETPIKSILKNTCHRYPPISQSTVTQITTALTQNY